MSHRLNNGLSLGLLALVQLSVMLIVQPHGNFPLNDDWAYAHSVEWLLGEGRLRLSDWIAPNILPQALLGWAASRLGGYSLETLRHVTQVVALAASVAAFYWFRANRLSPAHALVATLVLLAMPSWPVLANSFMSDLYGLLPGLLAATLFLKALDRPSPARIAGATALACLGVLQRQVLLVLPFAFLLAWLWRCRGGGQSVRRLAIGLLPLVAAVLALVAYRAYLEAGPGIPRAQAKGTSRFLPLLASTLAGEQDMRQFVLFNLATMTAYLGWFFAPWAAWRGAALGRRRGLLLLLLAAALGALLLAMGWLPPYLDNNTIDAAGIGPFTLYDALPRQLVALQRAPGAIWVVCALVSAAGCAALLALVFGTARRARSADPESVFLAAVVLAYSAPFLLTGYFDRYLLFLLPFVMSLWCRTWPAWQDNKAAAIGASAALVWLGAALLVAALATHDYFSWNRARWDAIRYAETLGATPEILDGGFEYNGYYRFEAAQGRRIGGKSWWWVKDDEFIVTFTAIPGYRTVQAYPVERYLSRTPARVLLSRRPAEPPPD